MATDSNNPRNAAQKILAAALERLRPQIEHMQKAEEVGKSLFGLPSHTPSNTAVADGKPTHQQAPSKSVFKYLAKRQKEIQKAETFIDNLHPSDPEKRNVEMGKPDNNLPGDYKPKKVEAEGSGGEIIKKADADPSSKPPKQDALKPAGIPGAKAGADVPKPPKTPMAPGAKGMKKSQKCGVFAKLNSKGVD